MNAVAFVARRDAAVRAYRELGLVPIPLKPQSKLPLRAGWQAGDSSLWEDAPDDANVGLLTGDPGGGLVGLDFDERDLCRQVLGIPARNLAALTAVVETKRGYHVYARHSGVQTREPIQGCKGFTALGAGSLIVAPPSIHPSGWEYRFLEPPRRIADLIEFADASILTRNESEKPTLEAAAHPVEAAQPAEAHPLDHDRVEEIIRHQSRSVVAAWELLNTPPPADRVFSGSGTDAWSRADWLVALCLIQHGEDPRAVAALLMTLVGSKATVRGWKYALQTCLRAAETARTGKLPHRAEVYTAPNQKGT